MKRLFIVLSVIAAVTVISCKDREVVIPQEKQTVVDEVATTNSLDFCGKEHNRILDILCQMNGGAKGFLSIGEIYSTLNKEVKDMPISKDKFVWLMDEYRGFSYSKELLTKLEFDGLLSTSQVSFINDVAKMLLTDGLSNEAKEKLLVRMESEILQNAQSYSNIERDALLCFTSVAKGSMDYWPSVGLSAEKGPRKAIAVAICDAIGAAVGGAGGAIALGAAASYEASQVL